MTAPQQGRPALFLDRDGIINQEIGQYVWQPENFVLQPAIFDLLKLAAAAGMQSIIITNQGGIAKGLYTGKELQLLHHLLVHACQTHGVPAPILYYCPHHPAIGQCLCRKPGSLLFERAIAQHGLLPHLSWMLGDRARDLQPAQHLGIRTMLVGGEESFPAEAILPDVTAAAAYFARHGF